MNNSTHSTQRGTSLLVNDYPHIAKEWDYEKNHLDINTVTSAKNVSVYWKCEKGHSWQAYVGNRTANNSKCPYCLGIKASNDNNLEHKYPNIAKEWNYEKNGSLTPSDVLATTMTKVWWKCPKGHEWEQPVFYRTRAKNPENPKCPLCNDTRLVTKFPWVLDEWDYEKNSDINVDELPGRSSTKVWWKCSNGHSWNSTVARRVAIKKGKSGCPTCAGRQQRSDNRLIALYPEMAKEFDTEKNSGIDLNKLSFSSAKNIHWKCEKGHEWQEVVYARTAKKKAESRACPVCRGRKIVEGINDIFTLHPQLQQRWDYDNNNVDPMTLSERSSRSITWKCPEGHSYSRSVKRHTSNYDCPVCIMNDDTIIKRTHHEIDSKNITVVKPELAREFDIEKNYPIKPEEVHCMSLKKIWWICPEGHSYQRTPQSRSGGTGCIYCEDRKVLPGFNSLLAKCPDVAAEWDNDKNEMDADHIKWNSNLRCHWKCSHGHTWATRVNHRTTSAKTGCPYCNGFKAWTGFNDFETAHPDIAQEWDYEKNQLKPSEVTEKSNRLVWWICPECKTSFKTKVAHRADGHGCPNCITSQAERDLRDVIQKKYTIIANDRTLLAPNEIDIVVPHLNIGIEYNGIYWHSTPMREGDYHSEKWQSAKDKGYNLVSIWEDDFIKDRTIIINNILSMLYSLDNPESDDLVLRVGKTTTSIKDKRGNKVASVKYVNDNNGTVNIISIQCHNDSVNVFDVINEMICALHNIDGVSHVVISPQLDSWLYPIMELSDIDIDHITDSIVNYRKRNGSGSIHEIRECGKAVFIAKK